MSEPVGNSPRTDLHGLHGNSHKIREAIPGPTPKEEPREKVEKIVEGKVITRKKPFWKRAVRSVVATDAQSVGDFLLSDVIIPAVRNLIYEIGTQALGQSLFGDTRAARRSSSGIINGISSLRTRYDRMAEEQRPARIISRGARARHDFDEIILDTRSEAVDVLERLDMRIGRYGSATVADLYDFLGVTGDFPDLRWGWTNLANAGVRQLGRGFLLDLPSPEPLR